MTPTPGESTPDDLIADDTGPDDTRPDDTRPAGTRPGEVSPGEQQLADLLDRSSVSTADLNRLHARLEVAAQRGAVLDLAYSSVETPVGVLLLVRSERGLVRVAFAVEGHDQVLQGLSDTLSPRVLRAPGQLSEATRQVEEYFARQRTEFDLPLDFALSQGFRQDVQRQLVEISYGHTRSYTEVAALVGSPRAVRAVGSACATNPLPVVVPCHRVLRSDGSLGGYIGGLAAKAALLDLEGAA